MHLNGSNAIVAQSVEHRFCKPQVVGSSPNNGSILRGFKNENVLFKKS